MEKDVRNIITSWTGVEETIHEFMHREEKLCISLSDTGLLSGHQFDALAVIACLDIHNVTKIAKTIGCSKSAASIMLSKMMQKDLVTKKYGHNIQDNRSIYIDITPKGEEVLESYMETRLKVIADIYDKMRPELIEELSEGFKCFLKIYDKPGGFIIEKTKNILNRYDFPDEKKEHIITLSHFVTSRISDGKALAENPQAISKNLTFQQIGILKTIEYEKQNTVSKLVRSFGTSVSTVSVNVSRLARAGYVVKEYGKTDDNRETILMITPKAKAELASISEKFHDLFMQQYETMNENEKELLEVGLGHFDKTLKLIKAEVKG